MLQKYLKIVLGCFLASLGLYLLKSTELVTGGTAGLSLGISYLLTMPFGVVFFIINIPFYIFSFLNMGWRFTMTTIASVTILTLFSFLHPFYPVIELPGIIAAIAGGLIVGFGLILLFMNQASLGGANILALFLQKRFGTNPGTINFIFDFCVVMISLYSVGLINGVYSILSIAVTSFVISYFKEKFSRPLPTAKTVPVAQAAE
ncbi:YitT family protein [Terribacillus saccharophilus]|uniref:YitT family protein n=1 Tax=Terribacillus saccharophilus TaxID=361277 RepID=UPI003981FB17